MPLESLKLNASLYSKLRRKTSRLIKEILPPTEKIDRSYQPGYCMYVQSVPKQFNSFSFGKPEGIRVFIQSGKNVIAAADFLFGRKNLKLSYIYQGEGLKMLIAALNKLEKKYSKEKQVYHAELIYFFLAPGPYFLIQSGRKKQFYYSTTEKILPISPEALKKRIAMILTHHKKAIKNQFKPPYA
jgi:hypothetical protein